MGVSCGWSHLLYHGAAARRGTSLVAILAVAMVVSCVALPRMLRFRAARVLLWWSDWLIVAAMGRYCVLLESAHYTPLGLVIAFAGGHVLFWISLAGTMWSVRATKRLFGQARSLVIYYLRNRRVVMHYLIVALREELVWRATVLYVLGNSLVGILATSALFAGVHVRRLPLNVVTIAELFVFSACLGMLYVRTGNLVLVILIHMVRDVNVCWWNHGRRAIIAEGNGRGE